MIRPFPNGISSNSYKGAGDEAKVNQISEVLLINFKFRNATESAISAMSNVYGNTSTYQLLRIFPRDIRQ